MQRLTNVMCDEKPQDVTVWPTIVDVLVSGHEETVTDKESGAKQKKWICMIDRYEKDEYIKKLSDENSDLSTEVQNSYIALTELYEMLA